MIFSVVVPLYNKARYVERAVRSVLAQSCQDFDIIIVDDGSTDGSAEIVSTISDSRIRLIRDANKGVSAARNRGIQCSQGELVSFLDADDEWQVDFLETVLRLRNRFPEAGLFATAYNIVTPDGRTRLPKFRGIPKAGWEGILADYFRCAAFGDPPICASAVTVRRDIFHHLGGFASGKRMGEDLDMWGRIALDHPVAFSSCTGSIYHKDLDDSASFTFREGDEHPFIATVERLRSEGGPFTVNGDDVDCYVARLMLENARQYVLVGNYQRAAELVGKITRQEFALRRFMWGGRFNMITHMVWKVARGRKLPFK